MGVLSHILWPNLPQLSESPANAPPYPPAETAEINQYDLTDALIDTEKSQRDEVDTGKKMHL